MSADNWGVCPQCKVKANQAVVSSYGKVSEEEYIALINKRVRANEKQTLREDYEIGTDKDGIFEINYGCSCSTCGFNYEYIFSLDILNKAK